jgi:hypothetical protein
MVLNKRLAIVSGGGRLDQAPFIALGDIGFPEWQW